MEKLSLSSPPSYTTELAVCVLWMRSSFHWMDLPVKYHSKTFQNLEQMTGSSQNKPRIAPHLWESNGEGIIYGNAYKIFSSYTCAIYILSSLGKAEFCFDFTM